MPTYDGFICPRIDRTDSINHCAAVLSAFEVDYWPIHESLADEPIVQSGYVDNTPVTHAGTILQGDVVHSFRDDYYYRIHLLPTDLDMGNASADQLFTVEVWNAYFTGQLLDDIIETDTDGLELTEPAAFPTTFAPLESRLYQLRFLGDNTPQVDATYDFSFPAETPRLSVTGSQVRAWAFRPNWIEPVIERLEWKTDVLEHYDGTEQRIGGRSGPRRIFEFRVTARMEDRERLAALIWGWQANPFALPMWQEPRALTASALVGDTVVFLDTTEREFHDGGLAVILADSGTSELVEIDTLLADDRMTLADELKNNWPAGTAIYPARIALLTDAQAVHAHNSVVEDGRFQFQVLDPGTVTPDSGPISYRNYPVLVLGQNWREGSDVEFTRKLATLDSGFTAPYRDDESGRPARVQTYRWTFRGRSAIDDYLAWLYDRDGRRVPIWADTGERDLTLTTPIGGSDLSIRVVNIGYTRNIYQQIGRRDIVIRLKDGTRFFRHITGSIELSATEEQLSIGSDLGQAVALEDVTMISWLEFVRLDGDAVEIAWHTPEVIESVFGLRGLADDV